MEREEAQNTLGHTKIDYKEQLKKHEIMAFNIRFELEKVEAIIKRLKEKTR